MPWPVVRGRRLTCHGRWPVIAVLCAVVGNQRSYALRRMYANGHAAVVTCAVAVLRAMVGNQRSYTLRRMYADGHAAVVACAVAGSPRPPFHVSWPVISVRCFAT